jgi:hypothetical protein
MFENQHSFNTRFPVVDYFKNDVHILSAQCAGKCAAKYNSYINYAKTICYMQADRDTVFNDDT